MVGPGGEEVEKSKPLGVDSSRRTQSGGKRAGVCAFYRFSRIILVQNHEGHIQSLQALLQLVTHKTCFSLF